MSPLALAPETMTLWQVALGVGGVVLVVVVALLSLLLAIIGDIDRGVSQLWGTATRMAANTATAWQLADTAAALEEIEAELSRHAEVLESA